MLPAQTPLPSPPPPPPLAADPNFLISQLIPLIGAIAAMVVGGVVLYAFFKSDLATAIAERIRAGIHRRRHWRGMGGEWLDEPHDAAVDGGRVAALEQEVTVLRGQLSELAERVDFAERMLAERRERKLSAGP